MLALSKLCEQAGKTGKTDEIRVWLVFSDSIVPEKQIGRRAKFEDGKAQYAVQTWKEGSSSVLSLIDKQAVRGKVASHCLQSRLDFSATYGGALLI